MFGNPEIMRQLVNGRLEQRQREAADHRLAGPARRRRRGLLRMQATPRFDRRRRTASAPGPATA
jgi:hypothetical protein